MIYSISINRKVSIGICTYFYSLEKYNVYLMIYYFYIFEIVQGYLYLIFHILILFYTNLFYIF